MGYGAKTWARQTTRAKGAAKRKRSRTKTAKKSRRSSAPRAKKKRKKATRASASKKRTTRAAPKKKKAKKPRAAKKKKAPTFGYDPETGDKVYFADVEGGDLEYEQLLEKKPRTVSRYDPETLRKVKVPVTSSMARDWPTRKPAKKLSGLIKQGLGLGGVTGAQYVGTAVAKYTGRRVRTVAKTALTRGAGAGLKQLATAAGVSSGTAAAGIVAAALVGWNLGKAINYAVGNLDMRLDQALRNYLAARKEAAAKLGRPLTKAELGTMYAAYKETVVRIKSQDPQTFLRPGAGG